MADWTRFWKRADCVRLLHVQRPVDRSLVPIPYNPGGRGILHVTYDFIQALCQRPNADRQPLFKNLRTLSLLLPGHPTVFPTHLLKIDDLRELTVHLTSADILCTIQLLNSAPNLRRLRLEAGRAATGENVDKE